MDDGPPHDEQAAADELRGVITGNRHCRCKACVSRRNEARAAFQVEWEEEQAKRAKQAKQEEENRQRDRQRVHHWGYSDVYFKAQDDRRAAEDARRAPEVARIEAERIAEQARIEAERSRIEAHKAAAAAQRKSENKAILKKFDDAEQQKLNDIEQAKQQKLNDVEQANQFVLNNWKCHYCGTRISPDYNTCPICGKGDRAEAEPFDQLMQRAVGGLQQEAARMHHLNEKLRKEEEERAERRRREEAERRRIAEEEAERRRREEAERKRKAEEAERRRKAEEEAERKRKAEEAERRRKAEEEAERKRKAEEAERRRREKEEAERRRKIDNDARLKAEDARLMQEYARVPETREEALRIMQLTPAATPADITRAYRRLALLMHPDKRPTHIKQGIDLHLREEHYLARFNQLGQAYDLLQLPAFNTCSICMDPLNDTRPVVRCNQCVQWIHLSCAEGLGRMPRKCPSCRAEWRNMSHLRQRAGPVLEGALSGGKKRKCKNNKTERGRNKSNHQYIFSMKKLRHNFSKKK